MDGDQNGAEDQEVAQAGQVEQMRPAAGRARPVTMAAATAPAATPPYSEVTLVPAKKASQGEKLQISSVIGCSFVVLCSARCR